MRCLTIVALSAAILAAVLPADWTQAGTPDQRARQVVVEGFGNDQPAFFVGVDVDRPDRTYRGGDLMSVSVTSQKDGYLQLWYQAADGSLSCLFPNQYQKENRIRAAQKTVVPALASPFRLRVAGPYGQETLKAIVTLRPMTAEQLGVRSLIEAPVTPLDWQSAKAVIVELKKRPQTWAEHHVPIITLPPETTAPETAAPETTVPETTVPETTVPETTVPETTVPETTVPETAAPETAVPETTVPETAVPETAAPETAAPETAVPETAVPETAAPETAVPETAAPETAVPETAVPETAAPETAVPETTVPETAAPETAAPETAAPETTAPETTAPETTVPETTVPETTVPETTVPENTPPVRQPVRVGLFIGISTYRNTSDLPACQRDAQRMAEVFMQFGGVEKPIILINEQATRRDIERAIRRTLVETTQPGDEVIIYWSGHGSTMPDDNGDEPDKRDELLIPYDGQGGNLTTARRTMISDDVFGRWIQDLCGRNVVIILDTCYAAGMATGARSAPSRGPLRFDFLDNELSHTRDVGQGAALLCASSAKGYESNRLKHSVMTYYLIKLLEGSTDRISLIGAFRHLRTEVPRYVSNVDRTKTQIPVLYNFLSAEFFLRP